jgi:formiminoglutamase
MSDAKFQSLNTNLLFTKNNSLDRRLGDEVFCLSKFDELKTAARFLISGSCDDQGILLNGGRTGAAFAPDTIREFLFKMTWPLQNLTEGNFEKSIQDFGNFITEKLDLAERHNQVRSWAKSATQSKCRWMHLGGGHDYGFPSAAGFLDFCAKENPNIKPIVINFDAHLDVRPSDNGFNSGTPFYRLLNEFGDKIDFYEVGIQSQCNSIYHLDWAKKQGAKVFFYDQLDEFSKVIEEKKDQPLFISMDIDVFCSAEAPGCSQSWPLGLGSRDFFAVYKKILKLHDVRALGLYEVSPRWDESHKTAKLAALILYFFMFGKNL